MGRQRRNLPLAESFLVLIILAAYSWPASTFTHLRTTEKAPLEDREQRDVVRDPRAVSPGYTGRELFIAVTYVARVPLQHRSGRSREGPRSLASCKMSLLGL